MSCFSIKKSFNNTFLPHFLFILSASFFLNRFVWPSITYPCFLNKSIQNYKNLVTNLKVYIYK